MSIFPFINEDEVEYIGGNEELPLLREVAWNFEEDKPIINKLSGELEFVEGAEALKIWIYKAIKINRYEHNIYSWDYGCEIDNLIGQGYYSKGHIELEVKRYIEECLSINEYINFITFTEIRFENESLIANFKVDSKYGEVEISV